eukprot:COSAG05_NODE_16693_length_340_cov_1.676349_1_plen_61_part_10
MNASMSDSISASVAVAPENDGSPELMKSGAFIGGCICMLGSSLAVIGLNLQRWSLLKQARC